MPKIVFILLFAGLASCSSDSEKNSPWQFQDDTSNNDRSDASPDSRASTDQGSNNTVTCTPLDPPIGPCDPFCRTGCGGNETCVASMFGPTPPVRSSCVPDGTVPEHRDCGGAANGCLHNLGCVIPSGRLTPRCFGYCSPDGVFGCDDDEFCLLIHESENRIGVCVEEECTLFPNDNCPEYQNCYNTPDGLTCMNFTPDAVIGETCSASTQCNDDQECTGSVGQAREGCRAKCILSIEDQCSDNEACRPLLNQPYGVCQPQN